MPIYQRQPGVYRVVVWANGKAHERIVRGALALADQAELELRRAVGAPERDPGVDVEPGDASEVVWVGGHGGSFVYFVQAGRDGPIKIGFSKRSGLRLRDMQSGSPVRLHLLCVVPGGRLLERTLHRAFDRQRLDGEWFRPSQELLALVAELSAVSRRNHGLDPGRDRNSSIISDKRH